MNEQTKKLKKPRGEKAISENPTNQGWQRAEQTRRASQTSQTSRAYERAETPLSQRTSKVIPARLGERRAEISFARPGSFGSFVVVREILISPYSMNNSF